jgi:hypothetical protein
MLFVQKCQKSIGSDFALGVQQVQIGDVPYCPRCNREITLGEPIYIPEEKLKELLEKEAIKRGAERRS